MAAILDIGTEQFSNSESPCHSDASHQVSAQSDLPFGRRCGLKNFKMAILDIGTEQFSNSESPCHSDASHQVSAQSDLPFGRRSQQTFDVRLTLNTRQILTLDLRYILVVFANCFDVRI